MVILVIPRPIISFVLIINLIKFRSISTANKDHDTFDESNSLFFMQTSISQIFYFVRHRKQYYYYSIFKY